MDVKYNTDTKIEDNSRAFKLQKANFDKEVNTAVSTFLNHFFDPECNKTLFLFRKLKHNLHMNFKLPKFNKESEMKKSRFK